MNEVLAVFSEWWKPVLQSFTGGLLFFLISKYAPIYYENINSKYARRSLKSRKMLLTYSITKYTALTAEGADRATYFSALLYAVLREVVKGLVWLTLGLMTMSVIPIFGIVGFLGALYFFIKATNIISPIDTNIDKAEKLKELKEELEQVKESLNNSSNSDAVNSAGS